MSIVNHLNRKHIEMMTSKEIKVGYLWAGCLRLVQMAVWKSWLMQTLWAGQRTFRQGSLVASGPEHRSETELSLLEAKAD